MARRNRRAGHHASRLSRHASSSPMLERLESRLLLSTVPEGEISALWSDVSNSPFLPVMIGYALEEHGCTFAQASSLMGGAIDSILDSLGGHIDASADVTFSVGIEAEASLGVPGVSQELASLGTGYNLTYSILEEDWTLSRYLAFAVVGVDISTEYFASFDSILSVTSSDWVTFGVSAAVSAGTNAAIQVGQLLRAGIEEGVSGNISVTAETHLQVDDFLSNYVDQPSLAEGLADVFIPYYGDSWWENLLAGAASFIPILPLEQLLDITRTDTPLGILTHSGNVQVTVSQGFDVNAGAWFGLGGEVPVAPGLNVGGQVFVGVSLSEGVGVELWSSSYGSWEPAEPGGYPQVVSHQHDIGPKANASVSFSEDMAQSTFTNANIGVVGSSSGSHICTFSYDQMTDVLTIDPYVDFDYGETVTVTVGTGVKDLSGNGLLSPYEFSFDIPSRTYIISAVSGLHGQISPSGNVWVEEGGSLTFSADPEDEYVVDRWYVDGTEEQSGGDSYQISNVHSDHSVTVTFKSGDGSEMAVLSPNGGETYEQDGRLNINWESSNAAGHVRIELRKGGSPYIVMKESYPNSGSCSWEIPDDLPVGSNYKIRITALSSSAWDESDGSFSIVPETAALAPIQIWDLDRLRSMSENWGDKDNPIDGHYLLMADIDAGATRHWDGGKGFEPIGDGDSDYFRGVFDGQGHSIFDMVIDRPDERLVGMFAVLMDSGTIRNLALEYDRIYGRGYQSDGGGVGALVGESAGTIINCHSSVEIMEGREGGRVGGLVGENTGTGIIRNCSANGDIQAEGNSPNGVGGIAGVNVGTIEWCSAGTEGLGVDGDVGGSKGSYVGGIAGENYGTIRECFSAWEWVEGEHRVGGIVGESTNGAVVEDCYWVGWSIRADDNIAGGIAGRLEDGARVTRCYASGEGGIDSGGSSTGSLVGESKPGTVAYSFWNKDVMPFPGVGEDNGDVHHCYGETTAEMKKQSTFITWDFENVWSIEEDVSYPELIGIGDILSAPAGVEASTTESDGVHVSWDAVTHAMAYRVYRTDEVDGSRTSLGDWQSGCAFVDETAIPEVPYYYCIKAAATINGARESDFSAAVEGSREFAPLDPPAGIAASDHLSDYILVEWDASPGGNFYRVYRSESEAGTKTPLGNWQMERFLEDPSVSADTVYFYWVTASIDEEATAESGFDGYDTGIRDACSPSVTVALLPALPIETQDVNLSISATDNQDIDRIVLHWNDGSDHTKEWNDINSGSFEEPYPIGAFSADDVVSYWAEAWDEAGNRTESSRSAVTIGRETVSRPDRPSGPSYPEAGEGGTYETGGSLSNLGNPVEYQFDWGDGTQSSWNGISESKNWAEHDYYYVRARARSQANPERMSCWSNILMVTVDLAGPGLWINTNGGQDFETVDSQIVLEGTAEDAEPSSGLACVSVDTGDINEGTLTDWQFVTELDIGLNNLTVTAMDNSGNETSQTISVTRLLGPTANDDSGVCVEDANAASIDVLANDTWLPHPEQELEIVQVTQPAHGEVIVTEGGSNVTYQPDPGYNGFDSFSYTMAVEGGLTDTAAVSVVVSPSNDVPQASGQDVTTEPGQAVEITLGAADVETPLEQLTFSFVGPDHGTLTWVSAGVYEYVSDEGYAGLDGFEYTVQDTGDPHGGDQGWGYDAPRTSTSAAVNIQVGAIKELDERGRAEFYDDDGDLVMISLRGGQGTLLFPKEGQSDVARFVLNNTTDKSKLKITVEGRGAETTITDIVVNGSVKSITGKGVDLLGDLTVTGSLRKLQLDDVADGHTISIGPSGDPRAAVSMRFDRVADLTLDSDMPIKSIRATQWLDTDGTADRIEAPWLGKLDVRGDFQADLALSGQGAGKYTLGSAKVYGDLEGVTWDVDGLTGKLTVKGSARDVTVLADGGIKSITAGQWADTDATADAIEAAWLAKLTSKGHFQADLALSGLGAGKYTLGSAKVYGDLEGVTWDVDGPAGKLTVKGSARDVTVLADGGIKSITAGQWADTDGTADAIEAAWLAKLTSKGHFQGDLVLTGQGAGKYTLGSAKVYGDLWESSWDIAGEMGKLTVKGSAVSTTVRSSGGMKSITLGRALHADFLAGIADGVDRRAEEPADFVNAAALIKSFKIKGPKNASPRWFFEDSNLSAGWIGSVRLLNVNFDNADDPFGIYACDSDPLAREIKSVKYSDKVTGEKGSWPRDPDFPPPDADLQIRMLQ